MGQRAASKSLVSLWQGNENQVGTEGERGRHQVGTGLAPGRQRTGRNWVAPLPPRTKRVKPKQRSSQTDCGGQT